MCSPLQKALVLEPPLARLRGWEPLERRTEMNCNLKIDDAHQSEILTNIRVEDWGALRGR